MINRIKQFLKDQRGSAMTEFTITLPVWIVIFYGTLDIGFVPMEITNTQARASLKLWESVLDETDSNSIEHMTPIAAAIHTGIQEVKGRNEHNGRGVYTKVDGLVHAASIGGGGLNISGLDAGIGDSHFTESAYRIGTLSAGMSAPDTKFKTEDIVGDDRNYPLLIVDDGVLESKINYDSDSTTSAKVAGFLASILSQTGMMHSLGAGIRYGAVSAEDTGAYDGITMSTKPKYVYDALVSPVPMRGDSANVTPLLLARLSAESENNYAVGLHFCDSGWSDDEGGPVDYEKAEDNEEVKKDRKDYKKKCKGYATDNACEKCIKNPTCTCQARHKPKSCK